MKKQPFHMFVNALGLVTFISMVSTGLLLQFVLPPGSGRKEMLLGGGHEVIAVYWGLTRHEWGVVHLWLSLIFLGLLLFHFWLNKNWIISVAWGTAGKPQPFSRRLITLAILLFVLTALLFPWIGESNFISREEFLQMRHL